MRDTELVVISCGVEPFAVIHASCQSWSGIKVHLVNSGDGLVSGFLTGALGTVWTGWLTLDWLVDTERKLQTLDGARLSTLTGLLVPFFFDSLLSDHVSGVVLCQVGKLAFGGRGYRARSRSTP